MTEKLFWQDPYLRELQTRVNAVSGDTVALVQTIIFPESGGQEIDHGTIAGHEVLNARWQGKEIYYRLDPDHRLALGESVLVKIDWARRYRLIRLHFAAELVLEIVNQNLKTPAKTGAHISEEKARIDFNWSGNIAQELPLVEARLNDLIDADLSIESSFSDAAQERRYWRIKGFAQVSCGGTHPRRTGEIGKIRLKRKNPGAGRERIEIYLD